MTVDKIPTVTAPVVVVSPTDVAAPATVWDTQKFKAMLNKVTNEIVITPKDTPEETELKKQWLLEYTMEQRAKESNSNKAPYIITTLVILLLVVSSIVLILTFSPPTRDNTGTITQIIGYAGTITAALFAYLKSQDTHKMVNHQLDAWKLDFMGREVERSKVAAQAAFMDGKQQGRDLSDQRTDKLADEKKP